MMLAYLETICGRKSYIRLGFELVAKNASTRSNEFSNCAEQPLLIWIPCFLFLLITPLWIYIVTRRKPRTASPTASCLYKFKIVIYNFSRELMRNHYILVSLLICHQVIQLIARVYRDNGSDPTGLVTSVASFVLLAVAFILSLLLIHVERQHGSRSASFSFLLFAWLSLSSLVTIYSKIVEYLWFATKRPDLFDLVLFAVYCILIYLNLVSSSMIDQADSVKQQKTFPHGRASIFNRITFWWITSLIVKGSKTDIGTDDLWEINEKESSKSLLEKFESVWTARLSIFRQRINKKQPEKRVKNDQEDVKFIKEKQPIKGASLLLFLSICRVFYPKLMLTSFLKLIRDLLVFVTPLVLERLIKYVKAKDQPIMIGVLCAIMLFATASLGSTIFHQYLSQSFQVGAKIRLCLMNLIYKKSLSLSNAARKESTVGQMVNLISVNAQSFTDVPHQMNVIWSALMSILISLVLLWLQLGSASLAGVLIMIILIPFTTITQNKSKAKQTQRLRKQDKRVKTINELLNGIKVVKLYAWEKSFISVVNKIRSSELRLLRFINVMNGISSFSLSMTPVIVSMASFGLYILLNQDEELNAEKVFVSMALFNILRQPLFILPPTISVIIQAKVSLNRIADFLLKEDIDPNEITHLHSEAVPILVQNCDFGWSQESALLQNINFQVKKQELVAIIGKVGSGKSSLLSALCGEMKKLSGEINLSGRVAYAPQQPWIQNATLKENILFGQPFDEELYQKTLEMCCLKPDLEQLKSGDLTEIGEKGINLSGGQKQRVSLARCAYSNADIYLMDDVLSAVDSHVAKSIFDSVIGPNGILKSKTRILVTNSLNFLPQADQILLLDSGSILDQGNFNQLNENNQIFRDFIGDFLKKVDSASPLSSIPSELAPSEIVEKVLKQDVTEKSTKIIEKEKIQSGQVKKSTFYSYFKACNVYLILLLVLFYTLGNAFQVLANFWLSKMSDENENHQDRYSNYGIYALLGLASCVFIFSADFSSIWIFTRAAKSLHEQLLVSILKCEMRFFESTPVGRILNRFSKDIEVIESRLPDQFKQCIRLSLTVLSILIVVSINSPFFIVSLVPVFILYYFVQRFYTRYSRQLKRLESVSRSPIYAFLGESLNGVSTIRAFRAESRYMSQMQKYLDENVRIYYCDMYGNRWLGFRLETIASLIVFSASLFVIFSKDHLSPGIAGLSITYALNITLTLGFMVRSFSDFESNIVSVERVDEYCNLDHEDEWIKESTKPTFDWPNAGQISFRNYSVKYREELDFSLRDINFEILPGEKIGVVGRTGAGKSTLTLALFRILESNHGEILIDNINVKLLGLHHLRRKLTIIPQDPVVFSGSIRFNLDPFSEFSDEQIWSCLEESGLKEFIVSLENKLEFECSEGGENLSVGQRQLICLARALLRRTKILILDEATASIDHTTDSLIQNTIRSKFAECTVLTIAHRLNTIMDSNRILVIDKGRVSEFGSPKTLLSNSNSLFYSMAREAGLVN